jgi:hypothetical protein
MNKERRDLETVTLKPPDGRTTSVAICSHSVLFVKNDSQGKQQQCRP